MAWSLIAEIDAALGVSGGTTAGINTTGADLIIVTVTNYSAQPGSVSDSKGNTWLAGPARSETAVSDSEARLFYAFSPTVGSGHTFSSSAGYSYISVLAFSGSAGSGTYDQSGSNAVAGGTSIFCGSIIPTVNNELVIYAGANEQGGLTASLGTLEVNNTGIGGSYYGQALAYYEQPTAANINPEFSWTGSGNIAAVVASFRPFGTLITADLAMPVENTGAVVVDADSWLPIESIGGIVVDASPGLEFLLSQAVPPIPVEWLSALLADRPLPAEALAGVRGDRTVAMETAAKLSRDAGAPGETLGRLTRDGTPPLEMLATTRIDSSVPVESLGAAAVAVIGDTALLIEAVAAVRSDCGFPVEDAALLRSDRALMAEAVATSRTDAGAELAAETLAGLAPDTSGSIEWLGTGATITTDVVLRLEWQETPLPALVSLESGPGRIRLLATRGRARLVRRN